MKDKLIRLYNDLLEEYKLENSARLFIFTKKEYLNSNELRKEIELFPERKNELKRIDTPSFYSTLSNSIYVIYDYFEESPIKGVSEEILYYFSLIHEYRHVMQRMNKNTFVYYIRLMEANINDYYDNYNNDTHDDWYYEIDANLFAAKYLNRIKDNYHDIDYDYISLMNYIYSYDLIKYNFDKLIEKFLCLLKVKRISGKYIDLFFKKDGSFNDLSNIMVNMNNINKDYINIFITSKIYMDFILKNKLNKEDKEFLINELQNRIKNENKVNNININKINNLIKKLNIKVSIDYEEYLKKKKELLERLNEYLLNIKAC